MKAIQINTNEIRAEASGSLSPRPKAAFGDVLSGVSAMGPATAELTSQWTGNNQLAEAVLNMAFSGTEVARGAFQQTAASYPSYSYPGMMGSPKYAGESPLFANPNDVSGSLSPDSSVVPGTNMSTEQLMSVMNQNSMRLMYLQAAIQQHGQMYSTLSNISAADHRARMSMIEKFTARG